MFENIDSNDLIPIITKIKYLLFFSVSFIIIFGPILFVAVNFMSSNIVNMILIFGMIDYFIILISVFCNQIKLTIMAVFSPAIIAIIIGLIVIVVYLYQNALPGIRVRT